MAKLQPFGDKVVLKVIPSEEEFNGLLVYQDISKSNRGLVVAVGEGTREQDGSVTPLSMKVNDKVIFQLGTGLNYTDGKDSYKVLSARDILCKIVEE